MSNKTAWERLDQILLSGWAGRQFDSVPELAMHLAVWLMFFGLGLGYGTVQNIPLKWAMATIVAGWIIGIPAQIAVERDHNE